MGEQLSERGNDQRQRLGDRLVRRNNANHSDCRRNHQHTSGIDIERLPPPIAPPVPLPASPRTVSREPSRASVLPQIAGVAGVAFDRCEHDSCSSTSSASTATTLPRGTLNGRRPTRAIAKKWLRRLENVPVRCFSAAPMATQAHPSWGEAHKSFGCSTQSS